MNINNVVFVSCSKNNLKTVLEESLTKLPRSLNVETFLYKNNTEPLSKVYNRFIDENSSYYEEDTAIIFVHDDVYVNCIDIERRLGEGFDQYDVIGLAGTSQAEVKEPALWHLMGDKRYHRGAVAHSISNEQIKPYHITSFGPVPGRVLLIDGLFIATRSNVLKSVRFDISNPSRFHYYDLDFSLECNKNKFKIGVCDIPVVHMSPGLRNPDEEWREGQQWFINKWNAS